MRYRRQRTIKAVALFLGACFIGGILLHNQTDDARFEESRNKCNGPWCLEDPAILAGGLPIQHAPTEHVIREHVINDLARHHEADRNNQAAIAARVAADAAVNHDIDIRHQERVNEAAHAVREAADAAVIKNKEDDLHRRLVDKFNPANPGNILPAKKQTDGATSTKEGKVDVKAELKGAVQVAPPRDVPAASGPGEMGKPFVVDDAHKNESAKLFKVNSFNLFASDRISLNRSLPDVRPEGCASLKYPKNLPKTTLVIVFHNEAWTALWRTVHSAINRAPSCLQEVVLVDDASTQDHLKSKLDRYAIDLNFDVKVLHLEKRSGLTVARLRGAEVATGEILVFLDSHCECTEGWLEPMAYRIAQDRSHVVVPVIDVLDDDNLEYLKGDGVPQIGGFSWGLIFTWQGMQKPDKLAFAKNKTVAIRSPTMAGGLFAIDKAFFNKLGGYDEGFKVWGGENLELSFKTWMCGGTLETMPCSHVGHIFRHSAPYSSGGAGNFMLRNNHRLAEVWLDEYKDFFYFFNPNVRSADGGDISERIAIRKRLHCKSFGWFLHNVFPETHWPTTNSQFGKISNLESNYCLHFLDDKDGSPLNARTCTDGLPSQIRNIHSGHCLDFHGRGHDNEPAKSWSCNAEMTATQMWSFTERGEIKHDDKCLDSPRENSVVLYSCHFGGGNQKWIYKNETQQIEHSNGRCLDLIMTNGKSQPTISPCDTLKQSQKWKLEMKNWTFETKFDRRR